MLVQIRDLDALAKLPLRSLRMYLKCRGWKDEGRWGKRPASLFTFERDGRSWSIIVPHKDTAPDYPARIGEAVSALAEAEERSQLEVYEEISVAGYDYVHMHAFREEGGAGAQGALSLRQELDLLEEARNLFASAARAVEKPQPVYRGRPSVLVSEYLNLVRASRYFGVGDSLTLISPLYAAGALFTEYADGSISFPRQAALKLAEALTHADKAIQAANKTESMEPFQQAAGHGVSANLCDSLAALTYLWKGIVVRVSWAGEYMPGTEPTRFQFTEHSADVLKQAADHFRRNEPFLDETVVAWVVKLEREPEEFDGRAAISCVRNGKPMRLNVVFEPPSFKAVIRAFEERRPISLDGDIYRAGKGYELRRPRNLSLIMHE